MKYLITRKEHFKNERLSKDLKTITIGDYDKLLNFDTINEIFNSNLITEYNIEINNHDYIEISFYSNSETKYRFDIFKKKEYKIINHISFSLYNTNLEEYDKLTEKNEMIELMNRIKYIIVDLLDKKLIENDFCIGGSSLINKNNIYEYMLYVLVGGDGYEKRNTKFYDSGWGLYFSI